MPFQSFNPSIDVSRKVKLPEISYDYWPPVLLFWLLYSSLKGQVTSNILKYPMTEGDPHPGAIIGCMPFQSFNPSIDASRKVKIPEISYDYSVFTSCSSPLASVLLTQRSSNLKYPMTIHLLCFSFSFCSPHAMPCGGRTWMKQQQSQCLPLLLVVKLLQNSVIACCVSAAINVADSIQ